MAHRLRQLVPSLATLVVLLTACSDSAPIIEPSVQEGSSQATDQRAQGKADQQNDESLCRELIYISNADGSDPEPLAEGAHPTWSPDGRRIAFHRTSGGWWEPEKGEIYAIDVDGSNEFFLARGLNPAWAPDGGRIAFTSSEGVSVMEADGSGVHTIVPVDSDFDDLPQDPALDWVLRSPAWSPDGENIAFQRADPSATIGTQLLVTDVDGSGVRRLTPTEGIQPAEGEPLWFPDGSQIAFWSYGYGIATVDAAGGSPTSGFDDGRWYFGLAWSPSEVLTFSAVVRDDSTCEHAELLTIGGSVLLEDAHDAAWSPDGGRLVFVRVEESGD